MIIDCTNLYYAFAFHPFCLVYLCIYSFCIYFRSLNTIASHPLLFAFLLFSHFFEVDEMEDGGIQLGQWKHVDVQDQQISPLCSCALLPFIFLICESSWWYRPAGVEACWGMRAKKSLQKYFYENIKLLSATVMSPKKTKMMKLFLGGKILKY